MNEVELERLIVRLIGDSSSYQEMAKTVEKESKNINTSLESNVLRAHGMRNALKGFAGQLIGGVTGAVGGFGAINTIFSGVKLAAGAEEMETAFGVMLKSEQAGKNMTAKLQQFAADTPLNLADIQRATKMLLTFGVSGQEMVPTLKMLGDVAGGNAEKLMSLSLAFGQVRGNTRLMGGELNQMINAGFNPLQEISEHTGKSYAELKQQMEKGLITFQMVKESFKRASSEGGQFANGMQKASKTLSGLFSTMQDDFDAFRREIGKSIVEQLRLKEVVALVSTGLQEMSKWWKDLSPTMKTVIIVAGGLLAVIGALALAWPAISAAAGVALGGLGAVFTALTGPIGIAIAAVVALGAIFVSAMGGWQPAIAKVTEWLTALWEWLKRQYNAFLEWSKPILDAAASFFKTMWDTIVQHATTAWGYIRQGWDWLMGVLQQGWDWIVNLIGLGSGDIKTMLQDAFLMGEYAMLNFNQVADVAWKLIKYSAVRAFEEIKYWLVEGIPYSITYFAGNFQDIVGGVWEWLVDSTAWVMESVLAYFYGDNWGDVWFEMENSFMKALEDMVNNAITFGLNLFDLITGAKTINDLFPVDAAKAQGKKTAEEIQEGIAEGLAAMPDAFDAAAVAKKFNLPPRVLGDLEMKLKKEWEDANGKLGTDFLAFKEQRLKEFATNGLPEDVKSQLTDDLGAAGRDAGGAFVKGAEEKMGDLKFVLAGSVEAAVNLQKYQDSLFDLRRIGKNTAGAVMGGGGGGMGGGGYNPSGPLPTGRPQSESQIESLLKDISANTKRLADNQLVTLAPAVI